jgi:hypothetical protein
MNNKKNWRKREKNNNGLFLLPYVWKGSNFDGGMSNDL